MNEPTNPNIPEPGAAWYNVGAGWGWLVGDGAAAMATTVWEEDTDFDDAFTIRTGNVERQTRARVVPNRRSDKNTQDEREET